MKTKIYLGLNASKGIREIFRSATMPTHASHGNRYHAVVGPFRTMGGAKVMRDYGRNNPHIRDVAEAERMAKQLRLSR